jgi:DNA modification methylase
VTVRIITADVFDGLAQLPDESVHCVVTSPPYWGLRDYGTGCWDGGDPDCDHLAPMPGGFAKSGLANYANGLNAKTIADKVSQRRQQYLGECAKCGATRIDQQIGLEPILSEHIETLVRVFREVRRVLRKDGVLWLNYGDAYCSSANPSTWRNGTFAAGGGVAQGRNRNGVASFDFKPKDLMMMPARIAIALQADGWWLRADCIWHKSNPMPESCRDRPTSSHEHVFMLTRSKRYFYDADAVSEPTNGNAHARGSGVNPKAKLLKIPGAWDTGPGAHGTINREGRTSAQYKIKQNASFSAAVIELVETRAMRNVWTHPTEPFSDAHFATMPAAIAERCIKAGCPAGGTVLDPFGGAGTTGVVADRLGRDAILIELNPEYAAMAEARIARDRLERGSGTMADVASARLPLTPLEALMAACGTSKNA